MLRNTERRYGVVAKSFHWIMAALVVGMIAAGYALQHVLTRVVALPLYPLHKSIGIVILLLIVLRWGWRQINVVPPVPGHVPPPLRAAARATHAGLYLLVAAVPVIGILMTQSGGREASVFGWIDLPRLVEKNPPLHELLEAGHAYAAYSLLALAALHVAAALYHRFHYRDEVFPRMWPGGRDVDNNPS